MSSDAEQASTFIDRIRQLHKNPWIGLVGLVVGIVSLLLAIWVYLASIRYSQLAVYVQPVKTVIVSQQQLSDLRVFYQGQQVHDVTAVQLAVWNAGNEPIRPQDILEPIKIQMRPPQAVLKVNVLKVTRLVLDFNFSNAEFPNGTVPLSWKILEKGDGALLQIVYAGTAKADVSVSGVLIGKRSIQFAETAKPPWAFVWSYVEAVVLVVLAFTTGYPAIVEKGHPRSGFAIILSLLMVGLAAFYFYEAWTPLASPFWF